MKILPLGGPSCSMQTDGQTDMTKLIVASHKFANAPKKRRKQTSDSTYQSTGLVDFSYC